MPASLLHVVQRAYFCLECSDLVDDAPPITPGCPTSKAPCPTAPECQSCATCADPVGIGAPLDDGFYELRSVEAFISACAMWSTSPASGTLRVAGSVIDLVGTRPWLTGAQTRGARYSYLIDGEELVLEQHCPAEGAETTRVPYATANGILFFPSSFPSPEIFSMVFEKR